MLQTCNLYTNGKPPMNQLFVATAALWHSTGDAEYRAAADMWWEEADETFAFNWNNVTPQVRISLCSKRAAAHYLSNE